MDIKDFLVPSQIVLDRHPPDKAHLLDHLARRAAAALALPSAFILDGLLEREMLGSTGIGKGVALPHAQLSGVTKPFGVLARLQPAIDYEAIDGEPVDIVFLLLLPKSEMGEHVLACAAHILGDPEVLRDLRSAADPKEAYRVLVS